MTQRSPEPNRAAERRHPGSPPTPGVDADPLVDAVTATIRAHEPEAMLLGFWRQRDATAPGRVVAVFTLPLTRYLGLRHRHDSVEGPLPGHDAWLVALDAETVARMLLRGHGPMTAQVAVTPDHDPLGVLAGAPRGRDFTALDGWLVTLRARPATTADAPR